MVVIARPGNGVAAAFADDVRSSDIEVSLVEQDDPQGVVDAAADAARSGADFVSSVGGDGSINLVAEGLLSAQRSHDAAILAPVPDGTANVINHVLGLDSPADTVEAVQRRSSRTIDVGETDAGCFVLNASSGYDAAVIDDGADHSESRLGRFEFLIAGARRLRRDAPRRVRVTCDGESVFDGRAMSVIVMNFGQRGGDSFDLAPDARIDDGLLDVATVRCSTLLRTVWVFARLALGRSIDPRDVVRAQAARIDVEWERPVVTQRDGDAGARFARVRYEVRPESLRILCG